MRQARSGSAGRRAYVRTLSCVPASRGQENLYFLNFCLPVSRSRKVTIVFPLCPLQYVTCLFIGEASAEFSDNMSRATRANARGTNDLNKTQFNPTEKVNYLIYNNF